MRLLDANISSPSPTPNITVLSRTGGLVSSSPPLPGTRVTSGTGQSAASSSPAPDTRVPSEIGKLPASTPTNPTAIGDYEKRNTSAMKDNFTPRKDSRGGSSASTTLTLNLKQDEPKKRELRVRSPSPKVKRRNNGQYSPGARPRFGERDHWSPSQGSKFHSPSRRRTSTPRPLFSYDSSLTSPPQRGFATRTTEKKPRVQSPAQKMDVPQAAMAVAAPTGPTYPSLASVAVPQQGEIFKNTVCYNCGDKGHVFMECTFGCGHCGNEGHRTIDCLIVRKH